MIKNSFIVNSFITVLLLLLVQSNLQSDNNYSQHSVNNFYKNIALSVQYATPELQKKFPLKNYTTIVTDSLKKHDLYSDTSKYSLIVILERLYTTSTKEQGIVDVTSVVTYKLINKENNATSISSISYPHREKNYSKISSKAAIQFTREKSLQENINKYINVQLTHSTNISANEALTNLTQPAKELSTSYFIGLGVGKSAIALVNSGNTTNRTIGLIKIGIILNSIHKLYINYEYFDKDIAVYTVNYDLILPISRFSTKPFIGINGGILNLTSADELDNKNPFTFGIHGGLLVDIYENIDLEFGVAHNLFHVNYTSGGRMDLTETKAYTSLSLKF